MSPRLFLPLQSISIATIAFFVTTAASTVAGGFVALPLDYITTFL
jgi:hypothetical protein